MQKSIFEILTSLPFKENENVLILSKHSFHLNKNFLDKNNNINFFSLNLTPEKSNVIKHKNVKVLNLLSQDQTVFPFRDSYFDSILILNTLRDFVYRESIMKECFRSIKGGKTILVTELKNKNSDDVHLDSRISFDEMLEYLDRSGFILGESFETNDYEYGIIGVSNIDKNKT